MGREDVWEARNSRTQSPKTKRGDVTVTERPKNPTQSNVTSLFGWVESHRFTTRTSPVPRFGAWCSTGTKPPSEKRGSRRKFL